jgi:phage shock protein PspC (stress-responsive transcriptional regulator)
MNIINHIDIDKKIIAGVCEGASAPFSIQKRTAVPAVVNFSLRVPRG